MISEFNARRQRRLRDWSSGVTEFSEARPRYLQAKASNMAQLESLERFDYQVAMANAISDPRVVARIGQWVYSGRGGQARDAKIFLLRRGGASFDGAGTGYIPGAVYLDTPAGVSVIDEHGVERLLMDAYYETESVPGAAFNNVVPLYPDDTPGDFDICMRAVSQSSRYVRERNVELSAGLD